MKKPKRKPIKKRVQITYWTLYKDREGKFRVRGRARNGRKIWASSQGYKKPFTAFTNAFSKSDAPMALHNQPLGVELRWPPK